MMIHFDETEEFQKELKRLRKKYRSLDEDLRTFRTILAVKLNEGSVLTSTKHWAILTSHEKVAIVKTRLACTYLRGEFMRIVFACHAAEQRFCFLELYYKGDKENEDRQRYEEYVRFWHIGK